MGKDGKHLSFQGHLSENCCRDLALDLRSVREQAVSNHVEYAFIFVIPVEPADASICPESVEVRKFDGSEMVDDLFL